jgi:hypothetical protein
MFNEHSEKMDFVELGETIFLNEREEFSLDWINEIYKVIN